MLNKLIVSLGMIALLVACTTLQRTQPPATLMPLTSTPDAADVRTIWSIYDPNPDHLWNRVFRQLYQRTAADRAEYGFDQLDPLLWLDTAHLLTGPAHQDTLQLLDEFLSSRAERLVSDPLKRAMFQRDLWAVFDWLVSQDEPHSIERQALALRLIHIMRRVALSKDEIASLPDNYRLEVEARTYPTVGSADRPGTPFLPSDLFEQDSAWVPMGRQGGPVAMTHTEAFPFYGRSAFLVYVRTPGERQATLDFIESLNRARNPVTPIGSDVALVRRMLLIDDQGQIRLSPLVETIQLRHFYPEQSFHEFELDRARLFDGTAGGLIPKADLFMLFMGHGDVFEHNIPNLRAGIPDICTACHFEYPPIPNSGNTNSIISYSRQPFSLSGDEKPALFATTLIDEVQTVIRWKQAHSTWVSLQSMWDQPGP